MKSVCFVRGECVGAHASEEEAAAAASSFGFLAAGLAGGSLFGLRHYQHGQRNDVLGLLDPLGTFHSTFLEGVDLRLHHYPWMVQSTSIIIFLNCLIRCC